MNGQTKMNGYEIMHGIQTFLNVYNPMKSNSLDEITSNLPFCYQYLSIFFREIVDITRCKTFQEKSEKHALHIHFQQIFGYAFFDWSNFETIMQALDPDEARIINWFWMCF
jgi:hypothetical protein